MNTVFYRDRIDFKSYPYPVSSVSERPEVRASDIKEIRLERFPPEIVLKNGEVLFVERGQKMSLALFAEINRILVVDRLDIWSLLCEPFVDTEFTPEDHRRTMHQLAAADFLAPEVETIRRHIKSKMLAYNAVVWDWVDLSHMDVLNAFGYRDKVFSIFTRKAKKKFYDWTHHISGRAPFFEIAPVAMLDRLDAKLTDIAYAFPREEKEDADGNALNYDPHKLPAAIKEALAGVILPAYGAHHRYYHTYEHLLQVLDAIDSFDVTKEERLTLKLAALFHDVVYETDRDDNEEESAHLLREICAPFAPPDMLDTAEKLVLLTRDHSLASTRLEKCMADADLLILAQDEKGYDKFVKGVRNEYRQYTNAEWREGRMQFLEHIEAHAKKNGRIYANFHPMHEQQAMLNVRREKAVLESNVW